MSNIKLIASDIREEFPSIKFDYETNKWYLSDEEILRSDLISKILANHNNYSVDDCKLALENIIETNQKQIAAQQKQIAAQQKQIAAQQKAEDNKNKQLKKEREIELKIASLEDWGKSLVLDKDGDPKKTSENIDILLTESTKYKNKIRYNEFTQLLDIDGQYYSSSNNQRNLDTFIDDIFCDCNNVLGISNRQLVLSTLRRIALDPTRCYHPIKSAIESLRWDGKERLSDLFIKWLKVDDNKYTREVGIKYMYSIIKRIYEPGCKVDHLPIITGNQGIGKSTFFQRLGTLDNKCYTTEISASEFDHIDDQIIYKINSSIICTLDELGGMNRKDQNTVKDFFTKNTDKVRLKYGTNLSEIARHCVFAGSTNDEQFLNDYSSDTERRYWTLTSHLKGDETDKYFIYENFTADEVNQLYAEAYHLYKTRPELSCELSEEAWKIFADEQKQYKTLSTSPEREVLDEVLNRGYSTSDFISSEIFIQYCKNYDLHTGNQYINRIPMGYLRSLLKERRFDVGTAKLTKLLEDLGFSKIIKKVNGNKTVLFVRNNPIKNSVITNSYNSTTEEITIDF